MSFSKSEVNQMASDIEKALASVEKKYNVNIKRGNGTFTAETFDLKLKIVANAPDGKKVFFVKEAKDFEFNSYKYGMKPEDLGKKFMHNGTEYKIVGANPRAYKRPIMAQTKDQFGKNEQFYKFPISLVNL